MLHCPLLILTLMFAQSEELPQPDSVEVCNLGRSYAAPYEPFPEPHGVLVDIYHSDGQLVTRSQASIAIGECQVFAFDSSSQTASLYFDGDAPGSGLTTAALGFTAAHTLGVYTDRVEIAYYDAVLDRWAYDSYRAWPNPTSFGLEPEEGTEADPVGVVDDPPAGQSGDQPATAATDDTTDDTCDCPRPTDCDDPQRQTACGAIAPAWIALTGLGLGAGLARRRTRRHRSRSHA
jgi:hypothetical protein